MQLKYKSNSTNQNSYKIELYRAMCENMMKNLINFNFFINYAAKTLLNYAWQHFYTLQVL